VPVLQQAVRDVLSNRLLLLARLLRQRSARAKISADAGTKTFSSSETVCSKALPPREKKKMKRQRQRQYSKKVRTWKAAFDALRELGISVAEE
jgi:hypothetical protein